MSQRPALPVLLSRLRLPALAIGLVGLLACILGLLFAPQYAFRSYLYAYLFWLGLSFGGLALTLVSFLVGGQWGLILRRPLEAAAALLPLMLVLFIPLLFGLSHLYPWARADLLASDPRLHFKAVYLNPSAFIIRSFVYLGLWSILSLLVLRDSRQLDRAVNESLAERIKKLSAAGLLVYVFSMTFASVDWIMSREAHWYSTILGFIVVAGQALSAMALAILILIALVRDKPFAGVVRPSHFIDIGNLLLTLVILFAYLSFAQFLVIWVGNGQGEVTWYIQRTTGGWRWIGGLLIVCHFFIPFFLLLSRYNKRHTRILGTLAVLLLVMRLIDVFWWIAPSGPQMRPPLRIYWTDIVAPVAIGGIWLAAYLWVLATRPLMPRHQLPEMPEYGVNEASGSVG